MALTGAGGGITEYFIVDLADLEDVNLTNPQNGDTLIYQNGYWINGDSFSIPIDTEKNILALTPTASRVAWASDLRQLFFADGTNWWTLSSYLDKNLQNPDLGWIQGSNREGYGGSYITDKVLSQCAVGQNVLTTAGGLRYNATGLNSGPSIQAYFNSAWNNIVAGFNIQEVNAVLEHTPVGYTQRIAIYSGNSDTLGLNGIPLIQGYKISMGAYPVWPTIDGGTF